MRRHVTFCLYPGLPLFCLASALEVLRHANRFCGEEFYRWSFLTETDQPVADSNGLLWHPTQNISASDQPDFAFLVAGIDANQSKDRNLRDWLQRATDQGTVVGGISNGAFPLAAAGLLDDYLATTHWEDFESFCEMFPRVKARYQRFVFDRSRITCSGGSATLDMFFELVRQDLGNEISLRIARQMLMQQQSVVVPGSPSSRPTAQSVSAPLQRALSLIEAGVGQSITVADLASRIGISRRELLRRFRRELNNTPSQILAQRRLDRARSLILNTRLPLAQVAESVGFSSQSHLTSSYRSRFGVTPAQQRRDCRNASQRMPLSRRDVRDW